MSPQEAPLAASRNGLVKFALAAVLIVAAIIAFGGSASARQPLSVLTTPTPIPTPLCNANYSYATATATIVPGTVDTGNHCDDCLTVITLPFGFDVYGREFSVVAANSNGNLQFVGNNSSYNNTCLPANSLSYTVFPYWDDLDTQCVTCGIFTSVSGSAPNRVFNIEWRVTYFAVSNTANFEARLYEGQPSRFDFVYGHLDPGSATVGVQRDQTTYVQYLCNTGGVTSGMRVAFTLEPCGTPTNTPTPCPSCPTNTPLPTGTITPTRTPTVCSGGYVVVTATATMEPSTVLLSGSQCDDCVLPVMLPFSVDFYGHAYGWVNVGSNGNLQFASADNAFINSCLPTPLMNDVVLPLWDDLNMQTLQCPSGCGVYTSTSGTAPNRVFNIEWRAVMFPSEGEANFEVRLHESSSRLDFVYGNVTTNGATATIGIQKDTGSQSIEVSCNTAGITPNLMISFIPSAEACGTPTETPTPCTTCPTNTPTSTRTITLTRTITPTRSTTPIPEPTVCGTNYSYSAATATIVPGTEDTGNHCDDCNTTITLPFGFQLYNQVFNTALVGSNGTLQFGGNNTAFTNACLPAGGLSYAVLPYWDDLRTDVGTGSGVYTSISGSAPNRILNVEWRATYFSTGGSANFEVRLYEGQPSRFDYVYGETSDHGGSATSGVQKDQNNYTQYSCNAGGLNAGLLVSWAIEPCNTSPTATSAPRTPTNTPTHVTMSFTDVQPSDYFYDAVSYLYSMGAISGYADNTFRPYNNTTRAQLSKITVLSMRWDANTQGGPHFSDVPTDHPFYTYVETAYNMKAINGYGDGTFHPSANVTRGQLCKIVVTAMGWDAITPNQPHFTDVSPGSTFYGYVEAAYSHGIISGYGCGAGCLEFRPGNPATRGQISKIVYTAILDTAKR